MHGSLAVTGAVLCAAACAGGPPVVATTGSRVPDPVVRPGIEVLLDDSLHLVRGRGVGLVTNQSGIDARGVSDVERLRAAGVDLVALFSPEHGFRGAAAPGAAVPSSVDSATGLPIYSLYGRTPAPTDSMLRGIRVMLVDLQDAGARYYTYISTTVEVMRAAAAHGIPVVVLDRPDPIGGAMQGNVLDPAHASFVGRLAVPMRPGLTLGELARLAASDLHLAVRLTVVPAAGWRRDMTWDQTGLPFVPPSPNLRSLESLFHYPGLCLFEGTNLSVGRGTDAPFEQVGAPWLDTTRLLQRLRSAPPPGVSFSAVRFTPRAPGDGKYADTVVAGIRLRVTDRARYDPTRTAVELLSLIRALQPGPFAFRAAQFDRLAGTPRLREALTRGEPADAITAGWIGPLARFRARVRPFLLY